MLTVQQTLNLTAGYDFNKNENLALTYLPYLVYLFRFNAMQIDSTVARFS